MSDIRERSYYPSGVEQDFDKMVLKTTVDNDEGDEVYKEYPAEASVCPVCRGKGSYVNPAIDSQGLSADDFAEDPDFADAYQGGRYDVQCRSCQGRRVILVPTTDGGKAAVERLMRVEAEYRAMVAAELRMGA